MSNFTQSINIQQTDKTQKQTSSSSTDSLPINALFWAYQCLVKSSLITCESAVERVKGLNSLSLKQQQLNTQNKQLKWYDLPEEQTIKKTITTHVYTVDAGEPQERTYQYTKVMTNKTEIEAMQMKNSTVSSERQILTEKISVCSQQSHMCEARLDTVINTVTQTLEESSALINLANNITYQALLRQPS